MRQDDFLYLLTNEEGRPYVVQNGVIALGSNTTLLAPDGSPAWLRDSPRGWMEKLVKFSRNPRYFGLFRDFTVPLGFVGDGAAILRWLYWTKGIEGYSRLVILKADRSAWPIKWKDWYVGEIDLSKFQQDEIGSVTCNVMEGGLSKLIKAHENTFYEFDISEDPYRFRTLTDGMFMHMKQDFLLAASLMGGGHKVGLYPTIKEGDAAGIAFFSSFTDPDETVDQNAVDYFAAVTQDITGLVLTGDVKIKISSNPGGDPFILDLRFYNPATNAVRSVNLINQAVPILTDTTIPVNETFDVFAGEKVFLVFAGASTMVIYYHETELSLAIKSRYKATHTDSIYLFRLLELIVEKITDGKYTVKSDFLTQKKDIAVSSVMYLRQIDGAVIKTSLSQFFKSLNSTWSIGLGIENNKVVIEPLSYFFNSTEVMDLGVVDDWSASVAEDLIYNTIKIGWPSKDIEGVNGLNEFNATQYYSTPHKRIVKELDLVSEYRADPIGLELLRINLSGKNSTDSKSDNDTILFNIETGIPITNTTVSFSAAGSIMSTSVYQSFFVGQQIKITGSVSNDGTYTVLGVTNILFAQLVFLDGPLVDESSVSIQIEFISGGVFKLYRPAYSAITGITETETIYNTELSPKHNLLNNGPFIRSFHFRHDGDYIKFTKGDKNSDLSTTLAGVTVAENADVLISSLGTRLFYPQKHKFKTEVPVNLQLLLSANGYGMVKFTCPKGTFYGYVWEASVEPATNDVQEWEVLAAPINEVEKFI